MSASTSPSAGALQLRLSEQMQALSLVTETLTLRLLELEERLIGRLQQFILELGYGFCFVGRQYRLALGAK